MKLDVPELSLVVLIGASGSGKSTFAKQHFLPTEVVSSDFCRGMVCDDVNSLDASNDAFDLLHTIVRKRLARGKLTVVDATNVQAEGRTQLIEIAKEYHVFAVAIVLDVGQRVCLERNATRTDRQLGDHVVHNQYRSLKGSLKRLKREGFRIQHRLKSTDDVASAEIVRTRLWNNRRELTGPFDIIGDIHGCYDEFKALLETLGYAVTERRDANGLLQPEVTPPADRTLICLGDFVDRGPRILDCWALVAAMVQAGQALCVPGNHETKLIRYLKGNQVQLRHGLEQTVAELEALPEECRETVKYELREFCYSLISHYVLDGGKLVVAHAGLREDLQGRGSGAVRQFALYGETTGETDEFGLPVRYDWAADYRGQAMVVYGHTPVPEAEWFNRTICIDTGCVFGGQLTALRYPERVLVTVPAASLYAEPIRPLQPEPQFNAQHDHDRLLSLQDVMDKRYITTRLRRNVSIRQENRNAALELMSRFSADPRWLIYLPPTMSPCETAPDGDYLERPEEAFAYYRGEGVETIICEEKHMGSRAIVVCCKDAVVARERFGVDTGQSGICYTRTGRPFFNDNELEAAILQEVRNAAEGAGLWQELQTDWVCLDCELMPWSAKAQALLQEQYAPVGIAGSVSLKAAEQALRQATERGVRTDDLLAETQARRAMLDNYVAAYRQYCWPVDSLMDLRLAPFHLMASEGAVHVNQDHTWHMAWMTRLSEASNQVIQATRTRTVALSDEASCAAAIAWWREMTEAGGEGMVVKPLDFIVHGPKGLTQPAVKCRGREYLRIIYGPEYTDAKKLDRLRGRNLRRKRSLALREFALGIEGLERFVRQEPLRQVHECAFAVLALESEPVDPRL